jgi:hypothetical protein
MVIVLVPTGTPFSADRQLEAERGHFGPANHNSTANDSTAGISIGLLVPPMAPPGRPPTSCGCLRPTDAAGRHPAERRADGWAVARAARPAPATEQSARGTPVRSSPTWTDGRNNAIERTGIGETDIFTNVELR